MKNFKDLIKKAQRGDQQSLCELIEIFSPMIERHSYLYGKKDEDLHGELLLAFIKCIRKFELNETAFLQEFYAEGFGNES
jgi:hypothetical protein